MKLTSIRVSEGLWAAVTAEADELGISAAEFIREATIFRLGYRFAHKFPDDEYVARMRALHAPDVDKF